MSHACAQHGLSHTSAARAASRRPSLRSQRRSLSCCAATSSGEDTLSARLAASINTPLAALTLPARVALGALSGLSDTTGLQGAVTRLSSATPDTLLSTLDTELALLDERGADALRQVLPQELSLLLGVTGHRAPTGQTEEGERSRANPRATYSAGPPVVQARFAGGVTDNLVGSEVEALLRELRAAREALSAAAAPGAGSMRAMGARNAAQRLQRHLSELDTSDEWVNSVSDAQDAAALRAVLVQLRDASQQLIDACGT